MKLYKFTDSKGTQHYCLSQFQQKQLDLESVRQFLHFGYLLNGKSFLADVHRTFAEPQFSYFEDVNQYFVTGNYTTEFNLDALIDKGYKLWISQIEKLLNQHRGAIVVPISGGLDSRLILASVLKFVSPSDVCTYTFGVKGSLDFDIGNLVAHRFKTNHHAFDLTNIPFDDERISVTLEHSPLGSDLFTSPPVNKLLDVLPTDAKIWTGFMGDPSIGSHRPINTPEGITAEDYLIEKERYFNTGPVNDASLCTQEHKMKLLLDSSRSVKDQIEYWDISNRQNSYVTSQIFFGPFDYVCPFLTKEWLDFSFSLPAVLREGELFYSAFLTKQFPEAFKLPTKANLGGPLKQNKASRALTMSKQVIGKVYPSYLKNKKLNYIDFDNEIRENENLLVLHKSLLDSLTQRDIVLPRVPQSILNEHLAGKDYSRTINLLSSLELILQKIGV